MRRWRVPAKQDPLTGISEKLERQQHANGEIIAQIIPPPESPAVYSSVVARVAQIVIWAVILVLGVLAYYRYLDLAPLD
jgi:hypothetical protein